MNLSSTRPARARLHIPNMTLGQGVANLHPLLKSYRRHLRAEQKRPATVAHYVGASADFLAFCEANGLPPIERVTREHVETWLESLHDAGQRPYSIRNRFVGLRLFIRWLVAEGELRRDPMANIKPPKLEESPKDVVSREEVARALKHLETRGRWRDAAIVGVFYDTGMRVSELAGLRESDVDLETGIITLTRTKNGRVRHVRLSGAGIRLVDRYLRRRKRPSEWLFTGKRGPLGRSGLYEIVRRAFEAIGVEAVISPHDLRHTSASHVAGELSESQMMVLYGWQDSDMARHYTRQVQERLALDAHKRASPLENLSS